MKSDQKYDNIKKFRINHIQGGQIQSTSSRFTVRFEQFKESWTVTVKLFLLKIFQVFVYQSLFYSKYLFTHYISIKHFFPCCF